MAEGPRRKVGDTGQPIGTHGCIIDVRYFVQIALPQNWGWAQDGHSHSSRLGWHGAFGFDCIPSGSHVPMFACWNVWMHRCTDISL
jgi:hypothetical protein